MSWSYQYEILALGRTLLTAYYLYNSLYFSFLICYLFVISGELEDEDDDIDDDGQQYMEKLDKSCNGDDDDADDDDEIDEAEETALEGYETPLDTDDCTIDEYQIFKSIFEG